MRGTPLTTVCAFCRAILFRYHVYNETIEVSDSENVGYAVVCYEYVAEHSVVVARAHAPHRCACRRDVSRGARFRTVCHCLCSV